MDIVDVVRTAQSPKIFIPQYHQGPLFMRPGSSFTSILLLGSKLERTRQPATDTSGIKLAPQVLISPFPYEDWQYLWRLAFSIKDEPGILHNITKLLQAASLNILTEVSRPVNLNVHHDIEMVVSSRKLSYQNHLDHYQTLQRLKEALTTEYLEEFFIEPTVGTVKSPLTFDYLEKYKNLFKKFRNEIADPDRQRETEHPMQLKAESDDDGLFFMLPEAWHKAFREVNGYSANQNTTYLMHTNTSHQLMSLYFPHSNKVLWNIRIKCLDEIGALAAFSYELHNLGINLVSTNLAKLADNISQFDFVCEFFRSAERDMGDEINKAFNSSGAVSKYKPIVSTLAHGRGTEQFEWKEILRIDKISGKGESKQELLHSLEVASDDQRRGILKSKLKKLEETLVEKDLSDHERHILLQRIAIAKHLLRHGLLAELKVFLSYKYNDSNPKHTLTIRKATDVLKEMRIGVVTGRDASPSPDSPSLLQENIMDKIDECPYFIVILTPDNDDGTPTSWVIWEYGYAKKRARDISVAAHSETKLPSPFQSLRMDVFEYPENEDDTLALDRIDTIFRSDAARILLDWKNRYNSPDD